MNDSAGPDPRSVMAGVMTPVLLGSTAVIFVSFALPVHTRAMGASAVEIGALFAMFTGALLIARPLVGMALDRWGRKPFFVAAFGAQCIAMALFGRAETMLDFYLARAAQGIGTAVMLVTARTLVADFVASGRGEAMGRLSQAAVRGSLVGAFWGFTWLAALPIERAWRVAFVGYAICAAIAMVHALRLREPQHAVPRDASGPLRLTTRAWRVLGFVFLTGFATSIAAPLFLVFLEDKFDLPMMAFAAAFLPAGVILAYVPRHAGRLSDRVGRAPLLVGGLIVAACAFAVLPYAPSLLLVAVAYSLHAFGWAFADPAQYALIADQAGDAARGRFIGFAEGSMGAGAALGPLFGGYVYETYMPQATFVTTAALLVLAAAIAPFVVRRLANA